MKPWVREMLKEQGVSFSSVDEEMEYQQQKLEESKRRHSEDVIRGGADGDRARYEQGQFERQSEDYAGVRNREDDQIARRWRFE